MLKRSGVCLLALILAPPTAAPGDKIDKESKAWLDSVRALVTPEEEKTFNSLKDKADRDEFQKIFWARRNPQGPERQPNEAKVSFEKLKAEADRRFKGQGRPGSETDCAKVLMLLGEPDTQQRPGADLGTTWVYKDRPGFRVTSGQAEFNFDRTCSLVDTGQLQEVLLRIARSRIVSPQLAYNVAKDGHLQPLEDLLAAKQTPGQALLKKPRQDFPITVEPTMFVRTEEAVYLAGLVRGEAASLSVQAVGEKKTLRVDVACQAVSEDGRKVTSPDHEAVAEVDKDGAFLVSFGVILKPGPYTVTVGVLDPKSGKGSATTLPVKAPDLSSEEVNTSTLLVLKDVQDAGTNADAPLANFAMGKVLLVPRMGQVFSPQESITILAMVYGGKADEATQKPSLTVGVAISKDGQTIARAPEKTYDAAAFVHSVGPVPLTKYAPGKYVVDFKIKDNVTKKEFARQSTFEVR
jgi:GWxTD domain-containing protein